MQDVFQSEASLVQAPLPLFSYELGIPPEASPSQWQKWNMEAEALAKLLSHDKKQPSNLERTLLGKYSGTGGIGASLDAYYTPAELALCMWQVAQRLGFTGGRILEPSTGIGVLLQFMGQRDKATAIELMPTSGQILSKLFSSRHEVFQGSFENWINKDDNRSKRFDLVIGNPPFGIRGKTKDLDYPDENKQERYFLLRSLKLLKCNGLGVMILPHGVASHKSSDTVAFRKRVLAHAEVIAIHALPTRVFERATTSAATTDLWIVRRRDGQLAKALEALGNDGLEALSLALNA